MYSTVTLGHSLAKRLVEDPPQYDQPNASLLALFFVNFIIFIPVLIITVYTLPHVYTTLAAVEDPLPAYEAVSMNDDDDGTPKTNNDPVGSTVSGRPITSSLRATHRLLRSTGSWRANFRGLGYFIVLGFATVFVMGAFNLVPFIPLRIAHLLALLAVRPLATAWVHVVITAPAPTKSLFHRIRPTRRIYAATWFPTFLLWAAAHASTVFPAMLARVIGLPIPQDGKQPVQGPIQGSDIGKAVCVFGVALALQALLVIPAHTALSRVQASLLPADEDPLVPFDRSFGGRVEPEVVSGKGFATFGAAVKTVPLASWVRIYLLRVKVFAVQMATYLLLGAFVAVQYVVLLKVLGDKGEGKDGQ